jgi:hypothetical protein
MSAAPPLDRPFDADVDAHESYLDVVRAIGAKVKAGAPVPEFMLSRKAADDPDKPAKALGEPIA